MDRRALSIDAGAAGGRTLVALSGGADSVALLLLLLDAGADVCAAHFEHGIRGGDSVADMAFCQELCARLGVPFFCERADVPAARLPGEGLEAAARRLRYAFLRRAKEEAGAACIATAHHAGDQAETVLMHLLRGAGPAGAAGMREREGDLWRPLLHIPKQALVAFLRERGQDWREDATNAVADTPRNALRIDILPRMEALYPGAARALCRFSEAQAVESDFLEEATARWAQSRVELPGGGFWPFASPPATAILRRFFRAQMGEGATWERVCALAALCALPRGRESFPDGRIAEKTESGLYILESPCGPRPSVPLMLDGATDIPGVGRLCAAPCAPAPIRGDPFAQALSREALAGAEVRFRREGDWLRPLGMRGSKLLSDYFVDRGVERPLRDFVPLVARGREVLWAVGVGISANCALAAGVEAVRLVFEPQMAFYQYFFGGTKE